MRQIVYTPVHIHRFQSFKADDLHRFQSTPQCLFRENSSGGSKRSNFSLVSSDLHTTKSFKTL
ncbi:hypothetical protein JHK86_022539 [Glycine max]|nr:hypothetical protein JHK86_022539 [Glycine max]